jgi:hypothetical protein
METRWTLTLVTGPRRGCGHWPRWPCRHRRQSGAQLFRSATRYSYVGKRATACRLVGLPRRRLMRARLRPLHAMGFGVALFTRRRRGTGADRALATAGRPDDLIGSLITTAKIPALLWRAAATTREDAGSSEPPMYRSANPARPERRAVDPLGVRRSQHRSTFEHGGSGVPVSVAARGVRCRHFSAVISVCGCTVMRSGAASINR